MRWGACIILTVLACGCAAQRKPPEAEQPRPPLYHPAAAGSLVFDPPVTFGQPPVELSRASRNPDAFVGYESTSFTYFYIRADDRFSDDDHNRYERRAVSTRVGVSYR
jgi:hypothetical protein